MLFKRSSRLATILLATAAGYTQGADGLRIATWNITHYNGDRAEQIGLVTYGSFNGQSFDPDVICLQEMNNRNAVFQLVDALNDAQGSPGDWAAAPVYQDPRGYHHTALVYRTSKLEYFDSFLVEAGAAPPSQPRNVVRFDFHPAGYPGDESILSVFPLHFKAGYTESDLARKLVEAQIVADHIRTLPADRHVVLGADLNIRYSEDPAYQALNGVIPNTGVLLDPISRPGVWHNNRSFKNIHTQDPTPGAGGMDDRLDQVLLSPSLLDGSGFEYDGDFPTPWNLATTQDPNHSLRAWGNDGTVFNQSLRVEGNAMVGEKIAQAIIDLADPDGHIPVFLDLDLPPKIRIIGQNAQLGHLSPGQTAQALVRVGNGADADLWGTGGISPLRYSFISQPNIDTPAGELNAQVNTQMGAHVLTLTIPGDAPLGQANLIIEIESNDPETPTALVFLDYTVVGCNPADSAPPIGMLDFFDVSAFLDAFGAQRSSADLTGDSVYDFFDISAFLEHFASECP